MVSRHCLLVTKDDSRIVFDCPAVELARRPGGVLAYRLAVGSSIFPVLKCWSSSSKGKTPPLIGKPTPPSPTTPQLHLCMIPELCRGDTGNQPGGGLAPLRGWNCSGQRSDEVPKYCFGINRVVGSAFSVPARGRDWPREAKCKEVSGLSQATVRAGEVVKIVP
nr:hypothetical protein CFP56_23889 [Quercus suber]